MVGIKTPDVSLESLRRIFSVPEDEQSTLSQIDREISKNLMGFLKDHIVAAETPTHQLEASFMDTQIPDDPIFVSDQADFLMKEVVAQSVHVASPSFIGHMTSALPYFMLPLAKIMIALNQNLVKIETSKAFTPLERQVTGMLHHLIYQRDEAFYREYTQSTQYSLGAFTSGGTIANLTALWVAVNRLMPPQGMFHGVGEAGLLSAAIHYGYKHLAILVSERGHYSLSKAANILGIGKENLIAVPTDSAQKIDLSKLQTTIDELKAAGTGIVAVVGVAGTTETGNVDPLAAMAEICRRENIFFHVDAAWGGPALFSPKYAHLLQGIEHADSVTIDAHKQLYVPMGAGLVVFKSQYDLSLIEHHAAYIIRVGSRDLGRTTLEGSRPGMAMLVHSVLRVMGRKGFALLMEDGIEKAHRFATRIASYADFELTTLPELNLLTYRYLPISAAHRLAKHPEESVAINDRINALTIAIQKEQRELGRSFVSRTTLPIARYGRQPITVFRAVLANPLTTDETLRDILTEQQEIAQRLLANEFSDLK